MRNRISRITSLVLVISMLLAVFAVLPHAEGESKSDVNVVYNRGFEEGWDYDNGFLNDYKYDLGAELTYERLSVTRYNYYMRITPGSDAGGYLQIPIEADTSSGKVHLEFDFKANAGNNIGGIIMIADNGGENAALSHVVSLKGGKLYLLGQKIGDVPESFVTIGIEFDFDYSKTEGAEDDAYMVSAYIGGELAASRTYKSSAFGLSGVYFGAQENFTGLDREGDEYYLDNVKLYYGQEEFCALSSQVFGSVVDTSVARDYPLLGMGDGGGYLTGSPELERLPVGDESVDVLYNRYFSEGWNISNGFHDSKASGNIFELTTDYANDINKGTSGLVNYFMRVVQKNTSNGFMRINANPYTPREGKIYFEFDLKACANATIPCLIEIITPGSPNTSTRALHLNNGNLTVFDKQVGKLGEEWCHIVIEVDCDYLSVDNPDTPENEATDPTAMKFTAWVGDSGIKVEKVINISEEPSAFKGIANIRIGRLGTEFKDDHWYGMDNIQLYAAPAPALIADDNFGKCVSTRQYKDFVIENGIQTEITIADIAEDALNMKVNSSNALFRGTKIQLFTDENGNACGAPYKWENQIMVPLNTLIEYTGVPYEYGSDNLSCEIYSSGQYRSIAIGRDTMSVGGNEYRLKAEPQLQTIAGKQLIYVALDDVEEIFKGFYVTFDEVGFISICTYDDYLDRDKDEEFMRGIMKRFVYDKPSGDLVYELAKENTNNFDHPYIYINQDKWDYLFDVYHAVPGDEVYDEFHLKMIDEEVKYAHTYLEKYANLDENGNYLGLKEGRWVYNSSEGTGSWVMTPSPDNHSIAIGPYAHSNGYEPVGGRLNLLTDGENCIAISLEACAYAYQLTREERYARFVYDMAVAICQWQHWGPGHYLNAANATYFVAVSYDWCYDAFIELGLDPTPIEEGIYKHGTYTAWRSLKKLPTEFKNIKGTESKAYWAHIGNWNPVCSKGVFTGALSLMGTGRNLDEIKYVMEGTIHYLGENGMNYFAFDGSYRESAGYWCATLRTATACYEILTNACGTDFNISKAPGFDITNYFGSHIETSSYQRWNYHDDSVGSQQSIWYFSSAKQFNNPEFAVLRKLHIDTGKSVAREDTIYYDKEYLEMAMQNADVQLTLDYVMDSIDCVVSRESWERGSLYAGIMGGAASVAHGQYDSGNFIYDNKGIRWFFDLGKDDYNLYGGSFQKGYYKYSTEGNNVIAITSQQKTIPYGQTLDGNGEIISAITNEYGSASILDMSEVYGGADIVTSAKRGMLVTNDRKTVVIQDEITFKLVQNMAWFAHYNTGSIASVDISADGRTALMTSRPNSKGETHTLRVTMLTANRAYRFEDWDAYTYTLDATPEHDYSKKMNGVAEDNRDHIRKLVIVGKDALTFDVAVVLELIDPEKPLEVGYKQGYKGNSKALPPMATWVPGPDTREFVDGIVVDNNQYRPTANLTTLIFGGPMLEECIEEGDVFGKNRNDFFMLLAEYQYAIARYGREHNNEEILSSLEIYDAARARYDKYQSTSAENSKKKTEIAIGLIGIKQATQENTEPDA